MGSETTLIGGRIDEIEYVEDMDADAEPETTEEYLDQMDLGRMEWDRLQNDMYPHQDDAPETHAPHVHRDTDEVQKWMRQERREG